MSETFALGDELQINASDGTGTVAGPPASDWARWGVRQKVTQPERMLAAQEVDLRDWRNPRVG